MRLVPALVLTLLSLASAGPARAETELCTYGTSAETDLRRWLLDGNRYPPFLCGQSSLDEIRLPEKYPARDDDAWRHRAEVVIIDNRPKEPEKTRPSLLEHAADLTRKALKTSVINSGYTIIQEPSIKMIEIGMSPSSELKRLLSRGGCYKYATQVYAFCVTIAELRPVLGALANPEPPKRPARAKKKKGSTARARPPAPVSSAAKPASTPAPAAPSHGQRLLE